MGSDSISIGGINEGVATFKLRLLFKHPTIDPGAITDTLRLKPCTQARVGDRIIGIDGVPRRNFERESSWSYWIRYYDETAGEHVNERLTAFLEPLVLRASFVQQLSREGTVACLILSFPGQFHFGAQIAPALLRTIADLELELGLEVFPDSAT